MDLTINEVELMLAALKFSTDVYEDSGCLPKDSLSAHLTYLKEKALIKKLQKALITK